MIDRRELLRGMGIASASAILYACGPKQAEHARTIDVDPSQQVRAWLREAVERLAPVFPAGVHALAVQRRRVTAAVDVIGAGVARARADAVVITVRDSGGRRREHVSSELTAAGVAAVVRALTAGTGPMGPRKPIDFGPPPARPAPLAADDPRHLDDKALRQRAEVLVGGERSSRIVYAAGLLEIDDATVWSVAPGHDREQRRARVRRTATRVAWSGTRPIVSDVSIGWAGGIDQHAVTAAQLAAAAHGALEVMTPAAFAAGTYAVVLEPDVAASVVDAIARELMTATALRRPEVAQRLALGARIAGDAITLADDPAAPGAYGGFAFDDAGEPAAITPLVERGVIVGRLGGDGRGKGVSRTLRPGHAGAAEVAPSHLRVAAGTRPAAALVAGNGLVLEGARGVALDPSSGRLVIAVARARELVAGERSGRVFADVELVGDLGMLATITGVSQETDAIAYRDEVDGLPRWRSVETPWIAARGTVRGRSA